MTAEPTMVTTRRFSEIVRWARQNVLGLSLTDLADHADAGRSADLTSHADALALVETPFTPISDSNLDSYDTALYYASGGLLHGLIGALAKAHFGEQIPREAASRLSEAQSDDSAYPVALGLDVGSAHMSLIRASAYNPLPQAARHLTGLHKADFAAEAVEIAERRRGLLVIPYDQQDKPEIARLVVTNSTGNQTRYAGIPRAATSETTSIDPIDPITTLDHALGVAAAMGAHRHETAALAWGMLVTRASAATLRTPAILHWMTLDCAGPGGYQEAIEASVPSDFDRTLIPSTDHIWSVTRRYLSQWHTHFVRSSAHIDMTGDARIIDVRWLGPQLCTDPDRLQNQRIIFDENELPGLPTILACATPALYITETAMVLYADSATQAHYHWLPTGLKGRLLCRAAEGGSWLPVQTRPML